MTLQGGTQNISGAYAQAMKIIGNEDTPSGKNEEEIIESDDASEESDHAKKTTIQPKSLGQARVVVKLNNSGKNSKSKVIPSEKLKE